MATKKFPLVRGRAMRLTRLNGCGAVVLGADSTIVTEGFISVGMTPTNNEGEAISVTNANGEVCVSDTPSPRFQNMSVTASFCGVDPELLSFMTGQPVVLSADGQDIVGFGLESDIDLDLTGFALELWSKVPVAACDASGLASYGYFLLPFLQGGTLGDITVENAALNFSISGATTRDGNAWDVGPYDVVRDINGLAGPLNVAISANRHFHLELTTVPPPTATDNGAVALGVPATGATAGSPGTSTPADSYLPDTLAEMSAVTASPTSAWSTGQYVILGDGSTAYWNGIAWVAGVAP